MISGLRHRQPVVSINLKSPRGPWGGAGFFVQQIETALKKRGVRVQYHLRGNVDVILLMDPRGNLENKAFGLPEIAAYKQSHPTVRVLHRVNECDARKKTNFMDALLEEANILADETVFISEWLRDYHAERWFNASKPHRVIYNGSDPRIFNPLGRSYARGDGPLRLVTHHWSDNPMKGFDWYERIDGMIDRGELPDIEFWVIGRWPQKIDWRRARCFAPCTGRKLADLLRRCDIYVTASRWEPCGMHHVEGVQCGMPLLYHEDGGGIVEAGRRYGIGFREDFGAALHEMRRGYGRYLANAIRQAPNGDRMCMDFIDAIQAMICLPP